MTPAQRQFHARILATYPVRSHIRMMDPVKRGKATTLQARVNGRKGKEKVKSVPVFMRKKRLA